MYCCAHTHTHTRVCMYIYIYMYVCMYIHIHMSRRIAVEASERELNERVCVLEEEKALLRAELEVCVLYVCSTYACV
jgi:hypothetical protein